MGGWGLIEVLRGTKAKRAVRSCLIMIYALGLALPLAGCLLDGENPEPRLNIPQAYDGGPRDPVAADAALPRLDWWRGFRSPELAATIEEARTANFDIAAAVARIVQADAQSRMAGSALLPGVNFNAMAARCSPMQSACNYSGSSGGPDQNMLSASLTASYEIDFWGKNRSALRAAAGTAVASRYNREVVELATVVTAATAYFQVLTTQDRLQVARDNLKSAVRVLNLIQERLNTGTATVLDVAQQESLVDTQRAAIPPLEQTLRQNRIALAVLMGRTPESVHIRGGSLRSIAVPRVTPGLPSELLMQRPDIREAEAALAAANANIQNARAQMLPSITLTGAGGYQSAVLATLLRPESAVYSLAAGLAQPVFDGWRLQSNLDLQRAKQDELLQNYRKTVISAFGDVENALDDIRKTAERLRLQNDVAVSSRLAFDISAQRLSGGTVDLITVLQTQQALFQAQDMLVQARLAHVQAIVSLYQALGGGWQ
jgi:NodT family efflux transporter outer membrane factor (OMF) lipoprotein